ncbi:glycosyltransferase family 117 protein [Flavitalea flava]
MNFNRVNNVVGWIVGVIACTVYVLTMEPTGSFWDCGEFVSSCYKLQIPHPPGAPLFVLMGRFFIILFGDNPLTAARGVNFMSAIASGMSILFLFWTITHFARKIVQKSSLPAGSLTKGSLDPTGTDSLAALTSQQIFTIMSAGVVGALAYMFCDSYWYSAVEGEVYASSAFFTALVFWAALKWEHNADQPGSDKWIIFIFYMMGLSIGVHLLNLLTIPAIVMIYYFKRYKPTLLGSVIALVIGCGITGVVQKFVIQYTIKGAAAFDIFFVNSLNMPFFVGFAVFFIVLTAALVFAIRWAVRKQYYYLKLGLWCSCFMLLGYSTYFTTIIRSNADPAVDMYNVDNPVSLVGYLSRDQYGDWPILYGPDFTDPPPSVDGGDSYVKGKDKYEVAGKIIKQDWGNTPSAHLFPRMWNSSNERREVDTYRNFSGLAEGESPTMADNIKYLVRYQTGWMYLRYFMWNFSGKQNDLAGFGNVRDGNAITGISFIDNYFLGDQSKLPDSIHTNNKSYNRMYLLPFILGMIGLVFQYFRNRKDFLVTGLLFFFTGFAIVIYLNQAGLQPRERDYAYAGSCYVFAIWIGLAVIWIKEQLEKVVKGPAANYAAAGLCFLAVPVLMGNQEWDDHDRSKKTLARDLARDYLESCPPNAILFSFGDNDTYPLWYAQEVEGIRPDVRVMVNTLLGTDWYMNQLRYKVNQSAPFDIIFTPEQIMGDRRNVTYYTDKMPGFDKNKYYDLYDIMKNVVGSDDPKYTNTTDNGSTINMFPVKKFSVPVDINTVRHNGTVHEGDSVVSELHLDLPDQKHYLVKNDLAILGLIAANKWQRPICFTSPQELGELGLSKYARLRGLAYQLVPVENGNVDNETAYKVIMDKFAYGNADKEGVYYDEENRRHLNSIKYAHAQVALSLATAGKKDSARKVLERFDQHVLQSNFPYGMTSNQNNLHDYFSFRFLEACYVADDFTLAKKVSSSLKKDLEQQMRYYKSLGENMPDEQLAINAQMLMQGKGGNLTERQASFAQDILSSYQILLQIAQWEKQYTNSAPAGQGSGENKPILQTK